MAGKKKWRLNLNNYRNTNYHILNSAKRNYTDYVTNEIGSYDFEPLSSVSVTLTYIPSNNRQFDLDNIDSVVRKFLLDALQKANVITDDGYKTVKSLHACIGEHNYDADDHYVIVLIKEI